MKCHNFLCVYEKNGQCSLDEITLDVSGVCADCLCPDFDPAVLQEAKEQMLQKS